MKKYHFMKWTKTLEDGRVVRRIIAARNFGAVRKGDHGGFIEDTQNLSHAGNCWVADNAVAAGKSRVTGNAVLQDHAILDDYASVTDDAVVFENAEIREDDFVYGFARVGGDAFVTGFSKISGYSKILCHAFVFGNATLCNASISGDDSCNYEIIRKRRSNPSMTICEQKTGTPVSLRQPAVAKAP